MTTWKFLIPDGFRPERPLKYCLAVAAVLIAVMALTSGFDRHPDELHHFFAAKYYIGHFLPPQIGDPAVRDSYSVWGDSYLNYQWIEYLAAGKFVWCFSLLVPEAVTGARLFQLFLFVLLSAFLILRRQENTEASVIACIMIVSPQLWYVFSYLNNDAFALVVAFLMVYQIASHGSLFRKFLEGGEVRGRLAGGIFFGLLTGILFTCKTNYWVFLAFAAIWILITLPISFRALQKYLLIASIALLFVGFRISLDFYVNGETNFAGASYVNYIFGDFDMGKGRLLEYKEAVADPRYKPSVIENALPATPPDVKMAAKGVPFTRMLFGMDWLRISFSSSVGVYGYMNIFGPKIYYNLMLLLYVVFGLYVGYALVKSRERVAIAQLLLTLVFGALSVFLSAYLSWTYAFQAQGRYLFPIVAMAALLVSSNRGYLNNRIANIYFAAAFVMSVYSFVFVGIVRINAH